MNQVLCPHRKTVLRFRVDHVSASGIVPGIEGEWNKVCDASDIWMMADTEAVLRAFRRMFPITHACSHVKCAKVKLFSSRASSARSREGRGSESSIVSASSDEECVRDM